MLDKEIEKKQRMLAGKCESDINERYEKAALKYNEKQKEFIKELNECNMWNFSVKSYYAKRMLEELNNGSCNKPSDFVKKELGWIFDGYILPELNEAVYYSLDHTNDYPYSNSYSRRSFRTETYFIQNLMRVLNIFHSKCSIDANICNVLSLNVSEESAALISKSNDWRIYGYCKEWITYELYNNNKKLEEILIDIINGDGEIPISTAIIRGILSSSNATMHEQVGKLLVAARLQEGLRQVICENADMGSVEGFLYILKVIKDNNLIRFSSVKRAVGTWLGLMETDIGNVERISDKSINLIIDCIEDEEVAMEYINTEDSMKIYIALWSIAFKNTKKAIDIIDKLSDEGSHHQVLTSGYFCANLDNDKFAHDLAKKIIKKHSKEYDIMAVYLCHFIGGWSVYSVDIQDGLKEFFEDENEAIEYYEIMLDMYSNIPKKMLEYNPCIFSWYAASLKKSDVIARMCAIAKLLNDNDKIDYVSSLIKECDADVRSKCVDLVLTNPVTKTQKEVVTALLCDKEGWTRGKAKKIVENMQIDKCNYIQMEQMLRYKTADIRETLISLLYKQDDSELEETVNRLLSDKKEEKRTAGLDILIQLKKDEVRSKLFDSCISYVKDMENISQKEQILIDNIIPCSNVAEKQNKKDVLYTQEDEFVPVIEKTAYIDECTNFFLEFFINSSIKKDIENPKRSIFKLGSGEKKARKELEADCESLENLIIEHLEDEYVTYGGEICTISENTYNFKEKIDEDKYDIPFVNLWKEWFENNIKDFKRLYRMKIYLLGYTFSDIYIEAAKPFVNSILGAEFDGREHYRYVAHMNKIIDRILHDYIDSDMLKKLCVAMSYWYIKCLPQDKVLLPYKPNNEYHIKYTEAHFIAHRQISEIIWRCSGDKDRFEELFKLSVQVGRKTFEKAVTYEKDEEGFYGSDRFSDRYNVVAPTYNARYLEYSRPSIKEYVKASYKGIITEKAMYEYLFQEENMESTLEFLSSLVIVVREKGREVTERGRYYNWQSNRKYGIVQSFLGKELEDIDDTDEKILQYCVDVYDKVIGYVLYDELRRGDTETQYSKYIRRISRIYGTDNLIGILNALGEDTLERSVCSYGRTISKRESLSHLLSVCIPYEEENIDVFKKKIKKNKISEKRLIEASLYSPEWLNFVEEYLNWAGFQSACYYFMAHINEKFDDKRKAMIAKYTPISEEDLNLGAFDLNWFIQAYETLGKKRFDMIYNAAKYISDGSKHARARKYADAALGKITKSDIESKINDKRNKDLVMSYGLIPLKDDKDIFDRYLFIQEFIKGSKKFGAQRIASEKAAADIAMSNLAINAGYSDVIRLTLQMETKLLEDSKELFEDKEIDDIVLRLSMENGKVEIICIKNGKQLKSIPAKYNKNEYVLKLKDTKKKLTEQYRRTRIMFEQAMEDGTVFTVDEIMNLYNNQVVSPIVKSLVYKTKNKIGLITDGKIIDYTNKKTKLDKDATVVVAHPYDLYKDGHWIDYQKYLFDNQIVQSFKQVFRELYIKTEEESRMNNSRRYSGHQIQPQKTVACLKSRRWIADVEDGLQKVYYKENIVARIYAMADWFTPADIEAPTLEWVEFSDRKTGKLLEISSIPDVIFSEVMRDVDLAVSVAHVGGVDPEASHSTVEMRAALISFTLPLFKLDNVRINDNHAVVEGYYGTYMINLGSGVVHKKGGIMIPILPVHSQHRGRIFLPFADEDPKTAEIMTKVLMLAEDRKIKDPVIIGMIK